MDNAAFHYSDNIKQMCEQAGVKLIYLAPYTPVTNPIEEFFGELKSYAIAQSRSQRGLIRRDFVAYVKACVKAVGRRKVSARGHFRNAGHYIKEASDST